LLTEATKKRRLLHLKSLWVKKDKINFTESN
jgi:hypothetical protein